MDNLQNLILVTDLDGTLLPSDKKLNPVDVAAITRFMAAGGRFSVATGRTLEATQPYLDVLQPNIPAILYNGAMLYDCQAKQPLATHPLPAHARDIICSLMEWNTEMGAEILTADGIYVIRNNAYETAHLKICEVEPVYTTLAEMPDTEWLKVLFALAPEDVTRLEAYANARGDSGVEYVRSSDIFLEILPSGASKGAALCTHRAQLGSADCILLAAGDFNNDLTMLQYADLGVAPSNAEAEVKKAAGLVLSESCNTGAIAALIDGIFSNQIQVSKT